MPSAIAGFSNLETSGEEERRRTPKLVEDGRIPRAGAIEAWGPMSGGLNG